MSKVGSPLRAALGQYRIALGTTLLLSAVLNVLLLGGSLYMMLVYDSVLPSRSVPTLVGLLCLVTIVYGFQALFDAMRTRILHAVAAGLDRELSPRIGQAIVDARMQGAKLPGDGLALFRDFDQVRLFVGGQGPGALMDLPWIAFFLAVLTMLHPWLGLAALVGVVVLVGLTLLTDRRTKHFTERTNEVAALRDGMSDIALRHAELLRALGMRGRIRSRLEALNGAYRDAQAELAATAAWLGGSSKVARMFLQSLILAIGAWLVIDDKASGGVIFASSVLSGRALAPVDAVIANWRGFTAAKAGWRQIDALLLRFPPVPAVATTLPPPRRELQVEDLVVAPPGTHRLTVNSVSFRLFAGDSLGVIGPSAAGKTTLGRALLGLWPPLRGSVRLDKAALDQWSPDALGQHLGYLPQSVELLEGTVAENIARFEPDADPDAVIAAAVAAGVHDLVVQLPHGYETRLGSNGAELSAGQRQRIGLARALYKDPFLVLLDEPNSNLDADGEVALNAAVAGIRARGGIVILIAHRPSALVQATHVLMLRNGRAEAFGPKDDVLARFVRTAAPRAVQSANDPDAEDSVVRPTQGLEIR